MKGKGVGVQVKEIMQGFAIHPAVIFAGVFMAIGMLASGCAYGRKNIHLETKFGETPYNVSIKDNNLLVVIDKVEDARRFSTDNGLTAPSVGLSCVLTRLDDSDASKARLVGRVGNGWGLPCGDVIASNMTVADHVRKIVEQAFADAGFVVISPGRADEYNVIHVSVAINNFWGWMAYVFGASASISLRLERGGTGNSISAQATNSSVAMVGSAGEWSSLFTENAEKIRINLASQLRPMVEKYR